MWTYDILIVITYYMRCLLENNVFYLQVMNAQEKYKRNGNYAVFVSRLNTTLDNMKKFSGKDIEVLAVQIDVLLQHEAIKHYIKFKHTSDRELDIGVFKDETLCNNEEYSVLDSYYGGEYIKKSELAGMVADYILDGIDCVTDKLEPRAKVARRESDGKKSNGKYRLYRLDDNKFLGEFNIVKDIAVALDIKRSTVASTVCNLFGVSRKHNFKVVRINR